MEVQGIVQGVKCLPCTLSVLVQSLALDIISGVLPGLISYDRTLGRILLYPSPKMQQLCRGASESKTRWNLERRVLAIVKQVGLLRGTNHCAHLDSIFFTPYGSHMFLQVLPGVIQEHRVRKNSEYFWVGPQTKK